MSIKKFCEKIILIILTISILLSFMATPVSNAGLDLKDGEFYYSGTTKGTYVVTQGIFEWLIDNLANIADWILGLITMGVRMAFVGWTALIEKLLTWSIETTSGMSNKDGLVVDSTDVTSIGDSSGNITVQAIVYNQVPLFNINFFELETDKTVSGTGQKLNCKTCGRTVEECCEITGSEGNYSYTCTDVMDGKPCNCNGCDSCEKYLANWNAEKPLVILIRESISMWYTIIRLLSMVAMLITLIAVGIKMALSTIASEKAVYKRMLVDWVVGMIILFAMHYLILFIITMNETLVNTVKETANSINKTQIQYINSGKKGDNGDSKIVTDDEIEISIYEEIRTRAYDPKLTVGLSGMIMYITLVYFAVRYSIVYLKRYLTVIVLTLMAPPLGVAYALQKALTGKSSSMKKWMTEFVMTVIIQIVHALIYAVFISTALVLSLQSVPGMIVALIFMNFALKAEKMFRQIFKMGDGDNSLAGSAAEAGDADKIQSNIKSATGLVMSAKPIAGVMMNTPIAKGIKSAGKIGLAGSFAAGNAIVGAVRNRINRNSESEGSEDSERSDSSDNPSQENGENGERIDTSDSSNEQKSTSSTPTMKQEKEDQALLIEGGDSLRTKAGEAVKIIKANQGETAENISARTTAQKDIDNYFRYQMLVHSDKDISKGKKSRPLDAPLSSREILGAHIKKAVNITNHYQVNNAKAGSFKSVLGTAIRTTWGTKHYDSKTGKMVYDGNGFFSQFSAENLLGLSKEDKNFLKTEAMKPIKGAVLGTAGMFLGLATMVAHPGLGTGAFVAGASTYNKGFKLPTGSKPYKGTYGNAKFPAATMQTIQQQLLNQAYADIKLNQELCDSEMVKSVRENHPDLYNAIMQDLKYGDSYSGIKLSGNINLKNLQKTVGTGFAATTFVPKKWARVSGILNPVAFSESIDAVDRYALVRERKQTEATEKEYATILKVAYQQETEELVKKQDRKLLMSSERIDGESDEDYKRRQEGIAKFEEQCQELGYTYNPERNRLQKKETVKKEMLSESVQDKSKEIENTVDSVIKDMYKVYGEFDTSDSKIAIELITTRLKVNGILDKNQTVEDIFSDGENTVKGIFEERTKIINNQMQSENRPSSKARPSPEKEALKKLKEALPSSKIGFDEEDKKIIQKIILDQKSKSEKLSGKDIFKELQKQKQEQQGTPIQSKGATQRVSRKEKKENKEKTNAIDEYLKAIENVTVDTTMNSERVVDVAIEKAMPAHLRKKTLKKSHEKLKKVLQFMEESEDGTLTELMDNTEEKVKNAKQGIEVNGEKLEFNETESKTLQLLFDKMKEEVVFNEYTKNVLDQKDSSKTLQAKKDMYAKHSRYLEERRKALIMQKDDQIDAVASKHAKLGVTREQIIDVVDGNASISDIANETVANAMYNASSLEKLLNNSSVFIGTGLDKEGKTVQELVSDRKNNGKIERKLTQYIEKELKSDVPDIKTTQKAYQQAKKKAALTGKIDIYSQLNDLL